MGRKITIENVRSFVEDKDGELLSTKYESSHKHLQVKCNCGHIWKITWNNLKNNKWCPKCGKKKTAKASKSRRNSIEKAQKYARSKNGECISKKYNNAHEKLEWKCEKGHKWKSSYHTVVNGKSWCWECFKKETAGRYHIGNINEIKKIIESREGKLLSKNYENAYTKLKIECKHGHRWEATTHMLKNGGTWCPCCQQYKGERIFRNLLEFLIDDKFPKRKPEWLINKQGNRLELDGYNEKLKLAFEYQGRQHFQKIPVYHKSNKQFKKCQEHDKIKKDTLKKKNISIIYPTDYLKPKEYANFILEELRTLNLDHLIKKDINSVDINSFY